MNVALLIPSFAKTDIDGDVRADRHPTMDYHALADQLRTDGARSVILLDFAEVDAAPEPLVRWTRRFLGRDAALAVLGFVRRRGVDTFFANSEAVALPLALLLRTLGNRRPGLVTIGHRLSTGKKGLFFRTLRLHREIDAIFVYAATQEAFGASVLGIPTEKLHLIPFHADTRFYRPMDTPPVEANQISAAGLEWRDYPTLIEAVRGLPQLSVRLAAASPWSKHVNETERQTLPAHVTARRYDYRELRELYASSAFVVVPLYENDFQAGVTTLLEAMAMGKAVIVTRTTGQTDVVVEGETGLYVASGDIDGWKQAIQSLWEDPALCGRLGTNARRWMENNASLDRWAQTLSRSIYESAVSHRLLPQTMGKITEETQ
jgi:glycosyltransferase involved in cell wall biosynthesis